MADLPDSQRLTKPNPAGVCGEVFLDSVEEIPQPCLRDAGHPGSHRIRPDAPTVEPEQPTDEPKPNTVVRKGTPHSVCGNIRVADGETCRLHYGHAGFCDAGPDPAPTVEPCSCPNHEAHACAHGGDERVCFTCATEGPSVPLPSDWKREGMVVVADSMTGKLLGCMGRNTWEEMDRG